MTRDEKQDIIINDFITMVKEGGVGGAFQACTGFGKTTVGIKIAKRLSKDLSIHVVVPTVNLKEQWEKILAYNNIYNAKVFVINTYLSLREESRSCFFLILDEAHRYTNEDAKLFSTLLDRTYYVHVLPLSATFNKEQLEFMRLKGINVFATVTVEEAAMRGWVSRFTQYNLGVDLTEDEMERYTKASNIMKAHAPYLDGLDVFTIGKDKEALWRHCTTHGLDLKDVQMRLARFNGSSAARKAIVYGAQNKIEVCRDIVNLVNRKTIVFSETKKFSEEVYKSMKDVAVLYHSGLKEKEKLVALQNIKRNEVKAICAPKALDEGIDIPSLKCGVIASGTSVERQQIQRIGRVTRYVPNEFAIIVNLYAKNTIEETWVKKRQKNATNIRWINQITEIALI
jgi:RNA polymerase primary sigma factor